MRLQTYYNWYHLMEAVLEVFLNWHSAYDDQSNQRPVYVFL